MIPPQKAQQTMNETSAPGLHMENVSHAFGDHVVVSDVSVSVEAGELVCLLGPSGCGKTTLLRLAAGLEDLQQGQIRFGDEVIADPAQGRQIPPEGRNVGLMFQDFALFPHLTVMENIAFGLPQKHAGRTGWVRDTLTSMGLEKYADAYPHVLSGGQQQRVALLRALAPTPRVLLLDEPFSGLDVNRRAQIRQDTFQILSQAGIATLMVTHDPEEAMFMADRILVMRGGRIVQAGQPMDIYFKPENAFVAELFGPINTLPCRVAGGRLEPPLGVFPASGQPDGTTVRVLIRPEAIILSAQAKDDAGRALTVLSARSLGRSTHLTLLLEDGAEGTILSARMPGVFLPDVGSRVHAQVAAENLLVFPAEKN